MYPLRIVIIEPSDPLMETIKWVLSHNRNCLVIGEAKREEEAVQIIKRVQPDVVVFDVSMAPAGIGVLGRIAGAFPDVQLVALLPEYTSDYRKFAHEHGAYACISKDHLEEHLAWLLERLQLGEGAVSPVPSH